MPATTACRPPPPGPTRRDALRRLLALPAGAGLLAGCDRIAFDGRTIHVPRAQVEKALANRFPVQTRWLGLFDVTVEKPVMRLEPDRNRIAAELDLLLKERLFDKDFRGLVGFDGALRFDLAGESLKLADVRVDRVAAAGLPDGVAAQTGRLGVLLAEQWLEGLELYRLDERQREELRRRELRPGAVTVKSDGLELALEPRAAP